MTSHTQFTSLENAPLGRRITAKLIDLVTVVAMVAPLTRIAAGIIGMAALGLAVPLAILVLIVYTALAEYRTGHTIGKRVMGLRVVNESGKSITIRQSFVRQLPLLTHSLEIDTLFALFTAKRQRVFELASGTRVVRSANHGTA